MKNIFLRKIEGDAMDARMTAETRRMYLPPAVARGDQSYWSSLEQRIMSHLNDPAFATTFDAPGWWNVLEGWSRAGMVAAGIVIAVSAALLQNQQTDDTSAVYEYVSATSAPEAFTPSVELATQREASVQQDAVLNYVLAR